MHTPACRTVCLCHNPDRLCIAEREALDDLASITNRTPYGFFRKKLLEFRANWRENQAKVEAQRAEDILDAKERRSSVAAETWWTHVVNMAWVDDRWKIMSACYQPVGPTRSLGEYKSLMGRYNIPHPFDLWRIRNRAKFSSEDAFRRYFWERCNKPYIHMSHSDRTYEQSTEWLMNEARELLNIWPTGQVSKDLHVLADAFYDTVKETLYSDPWSTVLSHALGLDYTEAVEECKHRYEVKCLIHPFYMWSCGIGLDLDNNPVDRVILFTMLGSPEIMYWTNAIIDLISKIGPPFNPILPQLETEELDMIENTDVCISTDEAGSWFVEYNGRKYPIKMGGLPKRESVYSEPFYNFVNGFSRVGISVRDSNYTVEVGVNYEILGISSDVYSEVTALMIPRNHPFFDLVKVEVDVTSLFYG